jgi:type VI secretion system protein VasG
MEKHHKVQILDEALEAAVRLSHRYIPARQLPDKSVSLIDTACARVAVSLHATPAEVDDSRKRIEALNELEIIGREGAIGIDTGAARRRRHDLLGIERNAWPGWKRAGTTNARWSTNCCPCAPAARRRPAGRRHWLEARNGGRGAGTECVERAALMAQLKRAGETDRAAGREPADPADRRLPGRGRRGRRLDRHPGRAHGEERDGDHPEYRLHAEPARDRPGPRDGDDRQAHPDLARGPGQPGKPIGVFMLAGYSGVGKTETALALAEALYGGEQNLITINMSEYQEAHTVSTLKGAPPGYVGYGEGGVLTEAVRRKPYSVVLLDEVEKAHPDVHEMFFQVFDKGFMEDGEGRFIDFKNTLIILTTNAGTDLIAACARTRTLMPDPEGMAGAARAAAEGVPAGAAGAAGDDPVLPAVGRDAGADRQGCSWTASRSGSRRATRCRSSTARTWSSWWCRAVPRANRGGA